MTLHQDFHTRPADTWRMAYRTEVLVPRYLRFRHVLSGGFSRLSDAVFPMLNVGPARRILDVGCGFGDTAIRLADATGPGGQVLGIDGCQALLDHAWHTAELMWIPNVRFACRTVEQGLDESPFDMVFSRFGATDFADPVAGLGAMRRCLRPGGRIAHMAWRDRSENPWVEAARRITCGHLPDRGDGMPGCGPDASAAADEATLRAQMQAAGFANIECRRIDAKVRVGRDVPDAVAFQLVAGPAGQVLRAAGALGADRRAAIEAELADMFRGVIAAEGDLWMDSACWLITADSPA